MDGNTSGHGRRPAMAGLSKTTNFAAPQILANIVGALVTTVYFSYLDQPDIDFIFDSQFAVAGIMTTALVFLGMYLGTRWSGPIRSASDRIESGQAPDPAELALAKKRVVNGPLYFAGLTFFNWSLAALCMGGYRFFFHSGTETIWMTLHESLRLVIGIVFSGIATGMIVFFSMDRVFKRLRPFFFPAGGLLEMKGVFRLRVRHRLLVTFFVVGVYPMMVLGALLFYRINHSPPLNGNPDLDFLFYITVFFACALLTMTFVLSRLVASSIAEPIREMEEAMIGVRQGNLDVAVRVEDNDELGGLADSFNHMIHGLRDRERMLRTLHLAMEVQQSLMPRREPAIEGLDIAGRSIYCDETGGDYYDYLESPDGGALGVIVGDVSDHGLPAALLMATARAFLRQRASMPGGPGEILSDVNRQIVRDVEDSGRFMTLFLCEVDRREQTIRWANAGHDPALLYDPNSDGFEELQGGGVALGLDETFIYREQQGEIRAGQVLLIGTDGIWETRNPDGEMLGKPALKDILRDMAPQPAREIVDGIMARINAFRGASAREDDVTLVVIRVVPIR